MNRCLVRSLSVSAEKRRKKCVPAQVLASTSATQCHLPALQGPSQPRVTILTSSPTTSVSAAGADAVKDLNEPLIDATISVYTTITSQLLPTPAKSHYTFNLRDLSKVFQGMLMAEPSKVEVSPPISTAKNVLVEASLSGLQTGFNFPSKMHFDIAQWVWWPPLWLLPGTSSRQIPLHHSPSLAWKQVSGHRELLEHSPPFRAGWRHGGSDRDQGGADVLSYYLILSLEASAPSALLRTLLWLQPGRQRLTYHRKYLGP